MAPFGAEPAQAQNLARIREACCPASTTRHLNQFPKAKTASAQVFWDSRPWSTPLTAQNCLRVPLNRFPAERHAALHPAVSGPAPADNGHRNVQFTVQHRPLRTPDDRTGPACPISRDSRLRYIAVLRSRRRTPRPRAGDRVRADPFPTRIVPSAHEGRAHCVRVVRLLPVLDQTQCAPQLTSSAHPLSLDVVYCHDVEFVSAAEVLGAVRELRRLRDEEGLLRYVGISGYPVDRLSELAEMVLRETGEPLDVVMSYANFTLQNTRLQSLALPRLVAAGVDVVPNASPLGMGLLRRDGVPIGSMGDFHPAPNALRSTIRRASDFVAQRGEKLEVVAIRFALESWLRAGARVGALGAPLARAIDGDPGFLSVANIGTGRRLGVSVMGVSNIDELDETLRVWHSILDGLENWNEDDNGTDFDHKLQSSESLSPDNVSSGAVYSSAPYTVDILTPSEGLITDRAWSHTRSVQILQLARGIRDILGAEWVDYVWASPPADFQNILPEEHVHAMKTLEAEQMTEYSSGTITAENDALLTPPVDADKQLE